MFKLPNAKRVRRSELRAQTASRSVSPESIDDATTAAAQSALASYFASHFEEQPKSSFSQIQKPKQPSETSPENYGKQRRTQARIVNRREYASSESDNGYFDSDPGDDANAVLNAEAGLKKSAEDEGSQAATSYEFRLFFSSKEHHLTQSTEGAPTGATQITLTPEAPSNGSGKAGEFVCGRPRDYYLATPWDSAQLDACAKIALTRQRLEQEASKRWPACAVPWRVRTIRVSKKAAKQLEAWSNGLGDSKAGAPDQQIIGRLVDESNRLVKDEYRRRKPGKKRRVMFRKKIQAALEAKKKRKEEEEERAREKTRKNREKKVRRKMKLKEKQETADN